MKKTQSWAGRKLTGVAKTRMGRAAVTAVGGLMAAQAAGCSVSVGPPPPPECVEAVPTQVIDCDYGDVDFRTGQPVVEESLIDADFCVDQINPRDRFSYLQCFINGHVFAETGANELPSENCWVDATIDNGFVCDEGFALSVAPLTKANGQKTEAERYKFNKAGRLVKMKILPAGSGASLPRNAR